MISNFKKKIKLSFSPDCIYVMATNYLDIYDETALTAQQFPKFQQFVNLLKLCFSILQMMTLLNYNRLQGTAQFIQRLKKMLSY